MASEDIGLADPTALSMSIAARDSYQMLGSPEGELALAQVVLYLALCPKVMPFIRLTKKPATWLRKLPTIRLLNAYSMLPPNS